MSERSVTDLMEDILDSIQQIEIYISGNNEEEFTGDRKTQDDLPDLKSKILKISDDSQ